MSVWQNLPEEVGWYLLPLPAYLPVWFGLVKCLQTALRFFFSSSFFSWPAWMDFTTLSFLHVFPLLSLYLFAFLAPPPLPHRPLVSDLTFWRAPWHSPGVFSTASHLCNCVIVWVTEREFWKCLWYLLQWLGKSKPKKWARGLVMTSKGSYKCVQEEGIVSCMG